MCTLSSDEASGGIQSRLDYSRHVLSLCAGALARVRTAGEQCLLDEIVCVLDVLQVSCDLLIFNMGVSEKRGP